MPDNPLPNCEQAYVEDAKLYSYLLNLSHPDGKGKAQFYHHVGYSTDPDQAEQLRTDLCQLACTGEVTREMPNRAGSKYVVVGAITAPNERVYSLLTVWAVDAPDYTPRLITAYPNEV
jgi:hypothetical protein